MNNLEVARGVVTASERDLGAAARDYKIAKIRGQYHSALEHTFLWAVDAEDPHLIEIFCIDTGIALFNKVRIVPLITFQEGVIAQVKTAHSL